MRLALVFLLWGAALPVCAGPVEFGMAEVQRAIAARGLRPNFIRFHTEISTEPPDTYRIEPGLISGGDLRGLMYGLLEAADQIRETGRLTKAVGVPATPVRGIRYTLRPGDLEQEWCGTPHYWRNYFAMLARNRFNRFHLMAPSFPYWTALDAFPQVRVASLSVAQRNLNLETLRLISNIALEYGLEFTLSTAAATRRDGVTAENAAPYTHAALARTLAECQAIRGVEVRGSATQAVRAMAESGRRLAVEASAASVLEPAAAAHLPVRLLARFSGEQMGLPYQPADAVAGSGYDNLLQRPRAHELIWQMGAPHLLLWGDPEYVRRAVPALTLGGSAGFEIDAPAPQTEARRDFDRHWLFYTLWGRLTYDPKTPDRIWMSELKRRFGAASADVLAAFEASGGVLGEVAAAVLGDPQLRAWVEVNPGGVLEAYLDAKPTNVRFFSPFGESGPSPRVTPEETAAALDERAGRIEAAISSADAKTPASDEWQSARTDFAMLALLARFHAHRMRSAAGVARFDNSGDTAALAVARREAAGAVAAWEKLAATSAALPLTAFWPGETGTWKDKLVYVRHDLKLLDEREQIAGQFGSFEFAFDFGGLAGRSTVAPRFQAVEPASKFREEAGYGWVSTGERKAHALPATPASEWRAVARAPKALPANTLYGDWIAGRGPQIFRIRATEGSYTVYSLKPDRTAVQATLRAQNGHLDVVFPEDEWSVCGLVVKSESVAEKLPGGTEPKRPPRPAIVHVGPKAAVPEKPLPLAIRVPAATPVKAIRLHYRPVNQQVEFKTLENAKGVFTIPAADVARRWDLMYYFEILTPDNTGWLEPDPRMATPYHVVRVEDSPAPATLPPGSTPRSSR